MRSFLHQHESGELRLVFTDLWDGMHERTEYRVINDDGSPVRRGQEFDGLPVYGAGSGRYVKVGLVKRHVSVRTENHAVADTEKIQCRRLASKSGRAKCLLCDIA